MEKITSRKNPICIHMKKLGENRSYRYESGEYLCDGVKLLEEAVAGEVAICSVITAVDIPFPLPLNTRVYYSTQSLINSISPLSNAQSLLFTCLIPEESEVSLASGAHILLDRVQDPGNVGTIIRTAFAFGIDTVLLTDGCADLYNPKTIRASMGAVFKQKTCRIDPPELATENSGCLSGRDKPACKRPIGARIIGASLDKCCKDVSEVDFANSIIAIGSEGDGLSDDILSLCDEKVTIPIDPACQSLNAAVAAAILMWEAMGKLRGI